VKFVILFVYSDNGTVTVVYQVILKGTYGDVFVRLFDHLCKLYVDFICYLLIIHYTEFLKLKYAAS
jgi:hypothetical protein